MSSPHIYGSAIIAGDNEEFRLHLARWWQPDRRRLVVIGLNPSKADAQVDDPTIRKCIGFATALDHDGLVMLNLYAYRATDPRALKAAGYPVGPGNDDVIRNTAIRARDTGAEVVCAWGANARNLARPGEVLAILREVGVQPKAFDRCIDGVPKHPLYLRYDLAKRGLLEFPG
jgi:hypothetical protein